MMNSKKRFYFMAAALFVAGVLILLTIMDSPAPDMKKQEVVLRADTKDITIDDMMKNLEDAESVVANMKIDMEMGDDTATIGVQADLDGSGS